MKQTPNTQRRTSNAQWKMVWCVTAFLCHLSLVTAFAEGTEPLLLGTKTHRIISPLTIDFGGVTILNFPSSGLNFTQSLVNNSGTVTLVNDSLAPGNSKYYGTNGSGTRGYFNLPSSGGIGGSIADQQVAFGNGADTITGSDTFKFISGLLNAPASVTLHSTGDSDDPVTHPYTMLNSGIYVTDANGEEVFRLWASDPNAGSHVNDAQNLYLGFQAGYSQPSPDLNEDAGYSNIGIGWQSMYSVIDGSENTALGVIALQQNTIGSSNTAIGYAALNSNIDGTSNVAVGEDALASNLNGNHNTGIGFSSGNVDGDNNTFVGYNATALSDGLSNVIAVGNAVTVSTSNTFVGGNDAVGDAWFGGQNVGNAILHGIGTGITGLTTANVADSSNKRYVTDAQLTVLGNTSGTNTGDQTSVVGITGTKAQFDTALTDGNFLYVGDVSQYTDELAQDAVGAMIDSSLNYVDVTPLLQRAALTGAITASAGSNTTALGSFNTAQLNTALSDNDIATGGGTATGTNTGDQTSIVGITGSLSEFNTALTGADFATGGGTVTGASSGTNTGDQTLVGLGGVPTSRALTIGGTALDLSADRSWLGNVTNDAQTKAAIVPNTAPSAGQLPIGNAGGSAYAPVSLSGPVSITSAGVTSVGTLNQNTTGSAATLTTGRTIATTGDVTYTSGSFNGSDNVTGTATVANVPATATFGSDLATAPLNTGGWTEYHVSGSNYTNSTNGFTDILVSGTLQNSTLYEWEFGFQAQCNGAGGFAFTLHGAGTGSAAVGAGVGLVGNNAAFAITAVDVAGPTAGTATTKLTGWLRGFMTTTSTGTSTLSIQAKSITNTQTTTVYIGGVLRVRKAGT